MIGIIVLGLLLGMQHALEADHLAALASISAGKRGGKQIFRHGLAWGVGHMLTLCVFAGVILISRSSISPALSYWLEFAVGVMLILLGANVLHRLVRERVHIHAHSHANGQIHIHAHSHADSHQPHAQIPHEHEHPSGLPIRSLLVGMVQGLAGSAALVVLAAAALDSPIKGLVYVLLFGFGSMLGMALLSIAISVPLRFTARFMAWSHLGIRGAAGLASTGLGVAIIW